MNEIVKKVEAFHAAFGIPSRNVPEGQLEASAYELRFALLEEENKEYLEACKSGDLVKIADALGDLLYVLTGTIITHGLQDKIEAVVEEIHLSNMSKLDADGKPVLREDGKVLKGPLYFRPNLEKVLKKESEQL